MPVKQATEVLSAPGGEADRVKKMMSARPTLNANQRRSRVRQDLSGASPDGTFVGRGGRTQKFGTAAMSRMPQQPAPGVPAGISKTTGVIGGDPSGIPDAMLAAQGGATGAAPDMPQGAEIAQLMQRRGMPMGGALPPGAAEMLTRPMPSGPMALEGQGGGQIDPAAIDTALAGAQGAGKGFGPGLPPQIMQRLQALRGGGAQGGGQMGIGMPGAGRGLQRSFADFWQGGAGGRGDVVY